jgi:integrase
MAVKKRGKGWLISIYLGRDETTGKKEYHYETFYVPTKSLALQRESELKRLLKKKVGPNTKISTVGELLAYWHSTLAELGKVQERTLEVYAWHIRRLQPVVGHLTLYDLTAFAVQEALKGHFLDVSSRTRKNLYATLRTALRRGYSWGLLPYDVTSGIIIPEVEVQEKPVADFEQLKTLLEVIKEYKHHLIVRLLIVTGMRLGEVLGLRWSDINFDTGEIRIIKTVDSRNRKVKDRPKTKNSRRKIILDTETLYYLRELKQKQQTNNKIISFDKEERLIFIADDGRPMRHRAVELTLKRALKKAGMEEMGIHSIRHSVLSILNDFGIPLADIIALSGHAQIASLEPYIHMTKTGLNLLDSMANAKSQTK